MSTEGEAMKIKKKQTCEPRRKQGRPPVADEDRLRQRTFRTSDRQWAAIAASAASSRMSVSRWLRVIIRAATGRDDEDR